MNRQSSEDLFLACLCEATHYIDHSTVTSRHLSERGAKIYRAIASLREEGWTIAPPNLVLERSGLEQIESVERIVGKIDAAQTIKTAEEKLLEAWQGQEMAHLYNRAARRVSEIGLEETSQELQRGVAELSVDGGDPQWKTPYEWAQRYFAELRSKLSGDIASDIRTGFDSIDSAINYWKPARMTILGARTSTGKTTLALQLVLGMALRGTPVGVISLEDHPTLLVEIIIRCLTDDLGAMAKVKNPNFTLDDLKHVEAIAYKVLGKLPLYIDYIPTGAPTRVARGIHDCVRKFGARVMMVDYVQAVRGSTKKDLSRRIRIMDAASLWKGACAETGAHLLLTSQLNTRDPDVRPRKDNLKECGDLEEMAEYVGLIHRLQRPASKSFAANDPVELILDKVKDGQTGVIPMEWDRGRACFTSPAPMKD